MYERSAIVLEKYYNNLCGFDKKENLKIVYKDYRELVEEIQKYQETLQEEERIINEFEDSANEIRSIQREQKKLYRFNTKLEEDRNQLFDNLDEDASSIEKKLIKIEENIEKNNTRLSELRDEYVKAVAKFVEKQKERNKYSRTRREQEALHVQLIDRSEKDINQIELADLKELKTFINSDSQTRKEEIIEIMINNGKEERVPFNENVIENATEVRDSIAKREADCYVSIFEKMKRLLSEVNNDDIKLDKYNKTLRDVSVKLAFLKAERMYIASFLDNERMTSINGEKIHKQLMLDACEKFDLDINQFNNLYELILKEIIGKASKKLYKDLYNKEYLKNIEEKERNFEEEANSIKIKTGTIINSNYWRTEEIKNIYDVFQKEISEKFEKDLSEFKLEISDDIDEIENISRKISKKYDEEDLEDDIFRKTISDDKYLEDDEYFEDEEYDDEDEDYDNEYYDDEDDEDDEYDDEDEDEDYNDDEDEDYNDDEDDEYDDEDEDDEYDDEDEDDEYDDDEDDEYDDDEDDEYDDKDEDYDDDDEDDEENEYYDDENIEEGYEDVHEEIRRKINNDNYENSEQGKKKKGIFNKFFKDKKD